jgi:hypothetical protein
LGDHAPEVLDVVAVEGRSCDHHLEPVELWRIVGTRHLNPTIDVEFVQGEVEGWRRQHTDIDGRTTSLSNAVAHGAREQIAGRTIVPPDGNFRIAAHSLPCDGGDGPANGVRQRRRQIFANDTTDVILPEDV